MELLDNSNWDYIMYYYHRPLTRSYSKPIVTLDENSCVTDYNCPVYWDVFLDFEIAVRPPNYDNTIKFQCDADTRKWNVTYLDEPMDQMLAECSIDTNQWSIISSDKQSWTQIDELDYSCYDS
uniref:Ricin B-type lectin domain-containing protein n=1 Tax=Caenorhabditis tropicalis TaxID=1561998 RepID=A0A1I7U4I7_9PELO